MRLADRLVWALVIVIVDTAAFAIPLAALVLAYVLVARPRWFREWVEQVYRGATPEVVGAANCAHGLARSDEPKTASAS